MESNKLDVVIPLGTGSRLKNFELRFCLRSIEKYLSGYRNVYIVGERPEWLQNVTHIPKPDIADRVPDFNIMEKVSVACVDNEVSEDFIFFNDDHFLLKPFEAATFPYYYDGDLDTYVKNRGLDGYGRRANNSLKTLQTLDLPRKYFDIHTPIVYNKEVFLKHVTAQDWTGDGFIIKSLYANSLKIEGVSMKDNKINRPPQEHDLMFSTFPHIKSSVTRFLMEQFPEMSKFERTGI
jgi:hypothetical protein